MWYIALLCYDSNVPCSNERSMSFFQVNPSEHAIIRAILHSAGQDKGAGEPCCIPIKLRGVSVFLQESPDIIKIESFQGMIVEECGCR